MNVRTLGVFKAGMQYRFQRRWYAIVLYNRAVVRRGHDRSPELKRKVNPEFKNIIQFLRRGFLWQLRSAFIRIFVLPLTAISTAPTIRRKKNRKRTIKPWQRTGFYKLWKRFSLPAWLRLIPVIHLHSLSSLWGHFFVLLDIQFIYCLKEDFEKRIL